MQYAVQPYVTRRRPVQGYPEPNSVVSTLYITFPTSDMPCRGILTIGLYNIFSWALLIYGFRMMQNDHPAGRGISPSRTCTLRRSVTRTVYAR